METIRVALTPQQRRDAAIAYRFRSDGSDRGARRTRRFGLWVLALALAANVASTTLNVYMGVDHRHTVPLWILACAGVALLAITVAVAYACDRGLLFPEIVPDVAITPREDGLLTVTPAGQKLVPWREIRSVVESDDAIFIAVGWRVIAVPKAQDRGGALWTLLEEKLTGKRMLSLGSDPRRVIVNTRHA